MKHTAFRDGRPHLQQHARQQDVGTVTAGSRSAAMARLYVIVHFKQCGQNHRLYEHELEAAD